MKKGTKETAFVLGVTLVLMVTVVAGFSEERELKKRSVFSGPKVGVEQTYLGFSDNSKALRKSESRSQLQAVLHSELLINSLPRAFVDSNEDLGGLGRRNEENQEQDEMPKQWDFWRVIKSITNPIGVVWEPLEKAIMKKTGLSDPSSTTFKAWWPRETLRQNRLLRSQDTLRPRSLFDSALDFFSPSPSADTVQLDNWNDFQVSKSHADHQGSQSLHKRNDDPDFHPYVYNAPTSECSKVGSATGTLENVCALNDCHPISVC